MKTVPPRKPAMEPSELLELIARKGISQAAAARLLGYTPRHVNRWAKGQSPIHAAIATHIRKMLKSK